MQVASSGTWTVFASDPSPLLFSSVDADRTDMGASTLRPNECAPLLLRLLNASAMSEV